MSDGEAFGWCTAAAETQAEKMSDRTLSALQLDSLPLLMGSSMCTQQDALECSRTCKTKGSETSQTILTADNKSVQSSGQLCASSAWTHHSRIQQEDVRK